MDARPSFLLLHEEAHWAGKARRNFSLPKPDQWRTVLPGHNSIAWCVWHIAYGEDWGIAALRGEKTLMRHDGWEGRLGCSWPTFGVQMIADEAARVGEAIDLDALWNYYRAVYEETRRFAGDFDFATLEAPSTHRSARTRSPSWRGTSSCASTWSRGRARASTSTSWR